MSKNNADNKQTPEQAAKADENTEKMDVPSSPNLDDDSEPTFEDDGGPSFEEESGEEGYISPMELLIQAQAKSEEYRNDYLRALADMKNLRQRTEREVQQARQFAVEAFAKDLLQVADNLERALSAIPESSDPVSVAVTDGVRMVATGLENIFKKHGVTRIQALNAPFNPNLHQAVMQVEDDSVAPDHVVRELQTGYLLNNRLLRPSMVGISKGGSQD
ncbi:MAG: nucleotide exchange factor GrpE [Magnetococcales bacterium]|nr:nucleotide exchange factor GrpE [Magnetococcales bacterium]